MNITKLTILITLTQIIIVPIVIYLYIHSNEPDDTTEIGIISNTNLLEPFDLKFIKSPVINSIKIKDYNWENGITTIYEVDRSTINVYDNNNYFEKVSLDDNNHKRLSTILSNIDKVYIGSYKDPNVLDGVIINFEFKTVSGENIHSTFKNVKVAQYSQLTKFISSLTKRTIQYHQYHMRDITE